MTIYINSAVKDAIERVQYLVDYVKEIPSQKKTLEYDLDETSADYIKNVLCENDINNCHFSENCLMVTIPLSVEEIAEKVQDRQEVAEYWAIRLVKWCEREEFKVQIDSYLDKYANKYKDVIRLMQEYNEGK